MDEARTGAEFDGVTTPPLTLSGSTISIETWVDWTPQDDLPFIGAVAGTEATDPGSAIIRLGDIPPASSKPQFVLAVGRTLTAKVYDVATLRLSTTTTYLGDGAVAQVAFDGTGSVPSEGTDTLTYTYDSMGRPDQTKRGATVLTDNGWNVTDTLASRADGAAGTSAFTYDWATRALTATSPIATGTTTTAYRLDGLIATRTAGNAETATLTYDPVKRPINVAYTTGGSLWQSYDRTGNVTAEGRTLTGISGNAGTATQAFTYDALRRVTKATIPGTNTTCGLTGVACYGYDRNGNRTSKQVNATTTTYTYHPTDEIATQTISGVIKTFTYNLYGSQTTAFDAANAVTTSAYDTAERLLTVTPPTGGAAAYGYDALGRITTKTIGSSVDTYSYLGSTETAWQIVNVGGSGITTKSALDATGARTAVTGAALTGYLGFDLHGNTALAENGAKVITDALRYDAWGELIAATTSALPTPWRYQGRLDVGPDAANPLYDFGARTYRPVTGAFTSLDSYAGQVIDPLSMNRFLYAEANPATFVDPDGHGVDSGIGNCMPTCPNDVKAAAAAAAKAKQAAADDAIEIAYITKQAGGATNDNSVVAAMDQVGPDDLTRYDWCSSWESFVSAALSGCTFRPGQFQALSLELQLIPGLGDLYQMQVINSGCDAIAATCLTSQERQDAAFAAWLTLGLIPAVGSGRLPGAVGFARGEAESALRLDRLQHGTNRLTKAGLLPRWAGTKSPALIRDLLVPILETPVATFDTVLRGPSPVKGFLGYANSQLIVVFVYKDGPRQGLLATSYVPNPQQLKNWGFTP